MTIATDPNSDSLHQEQDEFEKHFEEFASGKKPDPETEEKPEPAQSEGNGPEEEAPAPEEPAKGEPATEEQKPTEQATSDEPKPEGAEPAPEGEQAPDPWANASPELIAARDAILKERDEARHKAQSDASRVAALSRKLQQVSVQPTASAPAPAQTEGQKALDAKIKQLREDYGEIADPLIELIENQRQELQHVRTSLAGMTEQQMAQTIASETAALETRHPDWREIAQSPDFAGWLEIQPENIQRLAASWDARETSVVLTLFKAENIEATGQQTEAQPPKQPDAATGARRSQQLDGGRDVRSRPTPAASGPPEDFDAAFKYFEEKRREKMLANRR